MATQPTPIQQALLQAQPRPTATPGPAGTVGPAPLGGLDLGALATDAQAETGRRISGGQSLLEGYLNSLLGERAAAGQAATERDLRMAGFRHQMQMLAQAADSRLQGQRSSAASGEAARNRAFAAEQADLDRVFELGQAAASQRSQTQDALDLYRGQRLIDQEFADPALTLQDFGRHEVSPERGHALDSAGTLSDILARNPEQWQDDLAWTREQIGKNGYTNPTKFYQDLLEHYGNRDRTASLALWQLGYAPPG